jgi:translation initiation factor IF-3
VRLIDENSEQLGVVPTIEALRIAREKNLDLVEVAPMAAPPVCRLMDYGRFKYEQTKKERDARKNATKVELKEVRLRPKTDDHDINFKTRAIQRFLEEGDKVKVTLVFRGREMAHPQIGRTILEGMAEKIRNLGQVERMPLLEGRQMIMVMNPVRAPQIQNAPGGGAPAAAVAPAGISAPSASSPAPAAARPAQAAPPAQRPPVPTPPPAQAPSAAPASGPRPAPGIRPAAATVKASTPAVAAPARPPATRPPTGNRVH